MAYLMEDFDLVLREKMKYWLRIKDEEVADPYVVFADSLIPMTELVRNWLLFREEPDVRDELRDLKRRVGELERRRGKRRELTMADYVYKIYEKDLEEKHFGKIVAIDVTSKEIVGIGNTILETYNKAKEKTGKEQFDFRRVGYGYILRA